jgi:FkbM family methyltransferase
MTHNNGNSATKAAPLENLFRSLPDFKGKRRLGRYLFKQKIASGADMQVNGKYGCVYKLPHLNEAVAYDIFVNGIYEQETHDFLVKNIPHGSAFLDLGANIGSISIPLCRQRPDINCIGVEAAPWIYEYLQHNITTNGLQNKITCINKALSDREIGELPFYSPRGQFGKGSLSPVFTDTAVMVDTITIDNLLANRRVGNVGMIKIDIEGFEYFAFLGGSKLLQSDKAPDIVFEFVDWAEERANIKKGSAQELLVKWGYKIYDMEEGPGLKAMSQVLTEGSTLLFATKRPLNAVK